MLYDEMVLEKQYLEKEIDSMEQRLQILPEGRLVCMGSKTHPRYYQCIGKTRKYISKQNFRIAELLAEKAYIKARLKDFRRRLKGICVYLASNHPALDTAPKLVQSSSKQSDLLASLFRAENETLALWMQQPHLRNDKYPNQLKHDTVGGLKVRSKAESMIAMTLAEHKIPFHYEEKLQLGEIAFHPDFTVRHPKTGQIFFWEHFGYIEEESYQRNVCRKLQIYMSEGIYPGQQLIITWETRQSPLRISEIRREIQKFF